MIGKLRSYLKLPGADRRAFHRLFILVPLTHRALKIFGVRKVSAFFDRYLPARPAGTAPPDEVVRRYRRVLGMLDRNRPRADRCLARSLVLRALLRRKGVEASLHIGHRRGENGIEGHAWLEYSGKTVFDSPATRESFKEFREILHKSDFGL